MHQVFKGIRRRGINPGQLDALEVFGSDGQNHTRDIASVVPSLEIWEIEPWCEAILRRSFPGAEIKITDSYQEIKRTPKMYGLVVVDNTGVAAEHYEHFDLFPDIFRVLSDPSVMILNVIPQVTTRDPERMRRRQVFYNAADPSHISFDEIKKAYRALANQNGWEVEWIFFKRRWTFSSQRWVVFYAVLKLVRA